MTLMFHSAYSECSALAQAGGFSPEYRKNLASPQRSPTMPAA
jgi:hypothetical protein